MSLWINPVSGDWSNPADWNNNAVPTSADSVQITLAGSFTVSLTTAAAAHDLVFGSPNASLVHSAASLTMAGALTVTSDFVSLNRPNTIGGGVILNGGAVGLGNGAALG